MKKSRIFINIFSNFVGRALTIITGVLFVPIYINFIGIESYGLVGFYGTLLGTFVLLDFGLSTTLNRELAKTKVQNESPEEIRNLVFTLEALYWAIGLFICFVIMIISGWIADSWINAENVSRDTIRNAVIMMGVSIAFQWPISLYSGGLLGLEKHVLNNTLVVIFATLRGVGIILVLWLLSPTIEAFFIGQVVIAFLNVIFVRYYLIKSLPPYKGKVRFSMPILKRISRFALGMTAITLVTLFLTQADKIVVSKMVLLKDFAYYMLAFTICGVIGQVVYPLSTTYFPRFTALFAKGEPQELHTTYHQACRMAASIVFPVGFALIFFAPEILLIWTGNPEIVENATIITRVLAVGTIANALMVMPYHFMLAKGATRFTIIQNTIAAIILIPMLFIWIKEYGVLGATFVWLGVNVGYILISIPIIHSKILHADLRKWYLEDTLLPLVISAVLINLYRLLYDYIGKQYKIPGIVVLAGLGIVVITAILLSYPLLKQHLAKTLSSIRNRYQN